MIINVLTERVQRATTIIQHYGTSTFLKIVARHLTWHTLCRARKGVKIRVQDNHMMLNCEDYGLSRELWVHQLHEPITTALLQSLVKPGQFVIDVGANIGYYSILIGKKVGKCGKVIALEPDQTNFEFLQQNVELNGLKDVVKCHNVAAGDKVGAVTFYRYKEANWNSVNPLPNVTPLEVINVEVRPIDALLHSIGECRLDWVRMDTEGYEVRILDGMKETLRRHHPHLSIELHRSLLGMDISVEFLLRLSELGYEIYRAIPRHRDYFGRGKLQDAMAITIKELIESRFFREGRTAFGLFLFHGHM